MKIKQSQWFWGSTLIGVKILDLFSNPTEAKIVENLMWVKILGLPLEWWLHEGLKVINDCLGGTLAIDKGYKNSCMHMVAKALVNLNIKDGLYEEIDLVYGSRRLP